MLDSAAYQDSMFHLWVDTYRLVSESFNLAGNDPREPEDYRRWKGMTRFNQRTSQDQYLFDELLSKISRQSVALNDLIATILLTNTSFQDRVWQLVEDYDSGAEPITIYVSIESSKDCSRTMANSSWNIEEEFTMSCLPNFQLDNLEIHRADLLPAALRAATRFPHSRPCWIRSDFWILWAA
jgi:hypothetical protein